MTRAKQILKNYFYLLMALTIVAGTSAYKAVNVQTGQWYEVVTNDPNDQDDDVVGTTTPNPTQDGECINPTRQRRCSIRITHSNPSFNPQGMTIEEVEDAGGTIAETLYWDE